jgi:hypothetical protein
LEKEDKIKEEVDKLLKPLDEKFKSTKEKLENELKKQPDEKVKEFFKMYLEKEMKDLEEARNQIASIYEQNIRELIKEKNKDTKK